MLRFRDAAVTDPDAHALLEAYFAERALGFPVEQGEYRPTFPDAAQFTPPAGVFLVVVDDEQGEEQGEEHDDEQGEDHGDERGTRPGGALVGCGGVRRIQRRPETYEVRFEVKHLWLAPAARGRGEGRRLLAELERRAVEFGAQELVLDTNASLEAAGGLYRSAGYSHIEPYNANPNATDWYGKRV